MDNKSKNNKSPLLRITNLAVKGVKSVDLFGRKVSLNYKGKEWVRSATGGVVSVFVLLGLLYMIANYSSVMFNRERTTINTNMLVHDNDHNPVRYELGKDGYMFSVMLKDINGAVHTFDETYLELKIEQI